MQNQNELQAQVQNLNYMQQQLEFLQQQLELVENTIRMVESGKQTIEGIGELKSGDEIIVPISTLAFIKVNITEPENIMVSVGSDVIIEKNVQESLEYLNTQIEKYNKQRELISQNYERLNAQVRTLAPALQQRINQSRGGLPPQQ